MSGENPAEPFPAIGAILARYDREMLAAFVTVAIDLMDVADGDLDVELNGDENDDPGDLNDSAWPEWHTRGKAKESFMSTTRSCFDGPGGRTMRAELHEDTEIDDPAEEYDAPEEDGEDRCTAGDDGVFSGSALPVPYSSRIDGPGDAEDAERWEATSNVPTPLVFTLDHNIFTDRRVALGVSNLLTSFRSTGHEIRAADTGRVHRSTGNGNDRKPGVPV